MITDLQQTIGDCILRLPYVLEEGKEISGNSRILTDAMEYIMSKKTKDLLVFGSINGFVESSYNHGMIKMNYFKFRDRAGFLMHNNNLSFDPPAYDAFNFSLLSTRNNCNNCVCNTRVDLLISEGDFDFSVKTLGIGKSRGVDKVETFNFFNLDFNLVISSKGYYASYGVRTEIDFRSYPEIYLFPWNNEKHEKLEELFYSFGGG